MIFLSILVSPSILLFFTFLCCTIVNQLGTFLLGNDETRVQKWRSCTRNSFPWWNDLMSCRQASTGFNLSLIFFSVAFGSFESNTNWLSDIPPYVSDDSYGQGPGLSIVLRHIRRDLSHHHHHMICTQTPQLLVIANDAIFWCKGGKESMSLSRFLSLTIVRCYCIYFGPVLHSI